MSATCIRCGLHLVVPHRHYFGSTCVDALVDALAHERDRAKRVVRVFWRVRDEAGNVITRDDRWRAFRTRAWWGGKVYRVTVRRKKKSGKVGA